MSVKGFSYCLQVVILWLRSFNYRVLLNLDGCSITKVVIVVFKSYMVVFRGFTCYEGMTMVNLRGLRNIMNGNGKC